MSIKRDKLFLARILLVIVFLSSSFFGVQFVHQVLAAAGDVSRVSLADDESQPNDFSDWPTISEDSRYIAFNSYGSNLVAGDTNGFSDSFVRDVQTGITRRVSLSTAGAQGNDHSYDTVISANGRYATFLSLATNLVPQIDASGTYDVFVRDLQTGTTTAVSVGTNNRLGSSGRSSYHQTVSADGRYIAFNSSMPNLVSGDTNSRYDIFVRDMQTGLMRRVSVASNGAQSNGHSYYTGMSQDGRFITFHSSASNLVSNDTNGRDDIFVHDVQTGQTTRVSVTSSGAQAQAGHSWYPTISADGRFVAFRSGATNLVSGDTNQSWDIFVHDRQTGTTSLVSTSSGGELADHDSLKPSISGDGRFVVFDSYATNLVPGDTNAQGDIFVRDTLLGTTRRVSVASNGAEGIGGEAIYPTISLTGEFLIFRSAATNLVPGDTNGVADIFIYEHDPLPPNQGTATPVATPTPPSTGNPLFISLADDQTIGGIASADEDVLRFDGSTWSLFFDGSDVGLGSADLTAFSMIDADSLLMAFDTAVTVNGITAAPQDVVRFDATSLGETTAGTFSMYLDGSDVSLTAPAESLDAISLLADGHILVSTTGNVSVTGVTGADEDVLSFTPTSLGSVTSGTWAVYFDGSDVVLADTDGEDVDALDVTSNGNLYLSTLGNFVVNSDPTGWFDESGVSGINEDVFVCAPTSTGSVTACTYSNALYFDGSAWGLVANDVDAFHFSSSGPLPTNTPTNTPTPTQTNTPGPSPTFTNTPTATATFTPGPTSTNTSTPTLTFTPTNTLEVPDMIFVDGFESGDTSAWPSSSTDAGDLSVSPSAALAGSQGLQIVIDDNNPMYVADDRPAAEAHYRARFYFDPNGISMASGNAHYIFSGLMGSTVEVVRINFRYSGGFYQVSGVLLNDSASSVTTNWVTLSDAPHTIEVEWQAAGAPGANDGVLRVWLDGGQIAELTNIDNDTHRIDWAVLGPYSGIDTGTRGTYFFDAFESRRNTYIGP
ncbi:MAG TPA: hypothetical protein VFQ13_08360 [Anaerolineales bacterium]|nr:hypothetical protein [Anaerolineales bacterium]